MPTSPLIDESKMRLSLAEAISQITASIQPINDVVDVGLSEAVGRVSAQSVRSPIDLPPVDVSAMDGIACRHADLPGPLRVAGSVYAETHSPTTVEAGSCVRIMTGGAVPAGADTVVIRERTTESPQGIVVEGEQRLSQHIRRQGESIAAGEVVVDRGRRLSAADIGLIGSTGQAEVQVLRQPRVAIFATGSELAAPGGTLSSGQIFESNTAVIAALVRQFGCHPMPTPPVSDDAKQLEERLLAAAREADAVITSGGVSVGDKDFVPGLLQELGDVRVWKVRIKPGMPFLMGVIEHTPVFGLPGNPVSSVVTLLKLVQPGLRKLTGQSEPHRPVVVEAKMGFAVSKDHDRVEYCRVGLEREDGSWIATDTGSSSSARLRSLSRADALLELPPGPVSLAKGDAVRVESLPKGY